MIWFACQAGDIQHTSLASVNYVLPVHLIPDGVLDV